MSLLNDALRKKRSERFPAREVPGHEWAKPGSLSSRKRQWIMVSSGIALLAAASAIWLYQCASPLPSGRTGGVFLRYPGGTHAGLEGTSQSASSAIALSRAVAPPPVVPSMTSKAAPAVPSVQEHDTRTTAEGVDFSAAPPSPADDGVSSRTGDGGLDKNAPAGQVIETPSSQKRLNPEPRPDVTNAAHEAPPRKSNRFFQRALQFHRRNRLDQAVALYQAALKDEPDHTQARINLVAAYIQTGAYSQAYPLAAKLYSEDPANQQVMLNLAIAHIGCGRDRQALALLDKAENQTEAPMFEIAFHKAVALGHLGRTKSSLACYHRAENMRPDDPGLLFNMALAYDQQQQYGAAVDYYLKYLAHPRERDTLQIRQIRRRIRTLQAYGAKEKLKE
jgi:thioredoxin-like negative regulator of GroEL